MMVITVIMMTLGYLFVNMMIFINNIYVVKEYTISVIMFIT